MGTLKVTDWDKWTRAKKKVGFSLICLGVFLSFGVEESMMWGVVAIPTALVGAFIINSIRLNEW